MIMLLMCFLSGVIFAIGLGLSGMTQPQKITDFLNVLGNWDPSLLMVMLGAAGTYFIGQSLILKRSIPLLASRFSLPTRSNIDRRLIIGAALFGIGWGLVGFCPGPAITALVTGDAAVIIFVLAMGMGMYVYEVLDLRISTSPDGSTNLASKG